MMIQLYFQFWSTQEHRHACTQQDSPFPQCCLLFDPQAYDHNKDHVALWAAALASAPNTMQYLSGMAFHWYVNGAGCTIGTGDCLAEGKGNYCGISNYRYLIVYWTNIS